jgi:signal transduction histidine kinase
MTMAIPHIMRRLPFRLRLTLGFAGVMIVLFGGLALLLHTLFEASLDQSIERSLRTRAADLTTLVRTQRRLPPWPESGGAFAQIIEPATGRVSAATPGYHVPLLTRSELLRASHRPILVDRQGNARLLAEPVATAPPTVLVVGSSLAQRNGALTTLSDLLFIGGPVLLILTCLSGYALAARALAPVETMRAQAARISGAGEGERLPVPEANDELHRLGETLNAMLSRVEAALARERAFVADAGHELRTPLTILKLELELARDSDSSREELEQRLQSAAEEVDRLAQLARDLLVIGRAEQGGLPLDKTRIEVRELLGTVADMFAVPADGTGRAVRSEKGPRLAVQADRVRLEEALTNLVGNALRHGDGDVVLRPVHRNGSVELHVLDQGAGFDPDFLPHVFERFSRADTARSAGGTGLGLAIVQVIAEAHGGQAGAANADGGGADVWVSVPNPVRSAAVGREA